MTKSVFTRRYERFRKLLIEARKAGGLTQVEVARKLKCPQSHVSKYERGERRLDVVEFLKVAAVIGLDPKGFIDELVTGSVPAAGRKTILDVWGISAEYLTEVIHENPSLRGIIVGYVAERKLRDIFEQSRRTSGLRKDDDHDRTKKGDLVVGYKGHDFKIEVKSLQTNQIKIERGDVWMPRVLKIKDQTAKTQKPKYNYVPNPEFERITTKERLTARYQGAAQCDASDKRTVQLADGTSFSTTCLKVGEFDILAVGLFGFRSKWDFGFALNKHLPRSRARHYPPEVREQLLATLMHVTWPLSDPYETDPFILLDRLVRERRRRRKKS